MPDNERWFYACQHCGMDAPAWAQRNIGSDLLAEAMRKIDAIEALVAGFMAPIIEMQRALGDFSTAMAHHTLTGPLPNWPTRFFEQPGGEHGTRVHDDTGR